MPSGILAACRFHRLRALWPMPNSRSGTGFFGLASMVWSSNRRPTVGEGRTSSSRLEASLTGVRRWLPVKSSRSRRAQSVERADDARPIVSRRKRMRERRLGTPAGTVPRRDDTRPDTIGEVVVQLRTVIVEFDSYDIALAAHESEAYKKALHALGSGAERDYRIVEGV